MTRYRLLIASAILLLTLAGSRWGRRIEGATIAHSDFLQRLRLPFRDWATTDVSLSAHEADLLQPDAVLIRNFHSQTGEWAELAVIAGHRKRSIHTPGFCMAGGGWETLWTQGADIPLPGGSVTATRSLLTLDNRQILITYFFTDGDYCTRDLVQFQGVQILKRFQAHVPLGALVRIIVPVTGDQAGAEHLSDEFARALLPTVMSGLRNARIALR